MSHSPRAKAGTWRPARPGRTSGASHRRRSPPELGYESLGIFPQHVLKPREGDEVLAGCFEGWLARAGAFALLRTEGEGKLLATTFRFEDAYGVDPVATLLLNRLVDILLDQPVLAKSSRYERSFMMTSR